MTIETPQRQIISNEALGVWRANPTTKMFFQFLKDKRLQMCEGISESLFNGLPVVQSHIEDVARRCEIMHDLDALDAEDFSQFYAATHEEKENPNGKI